MNWTPVIWVGLLAMGAFTALRRKRIEEKDEEAENEVFTELKKRTQSPERGVFSELRRRMRAEKG